MKQKRVFGFIAGPSGIGKGYGVGEVLHEYCGAQIFVTGDWCRENASKHADSGILVDDTLIHNAVKDHFHNHNSWHYFVDAPRSVPQIDAFIDMFFKHDPSVEIFTFHIDGTWENCEARLKDRAKRQHRPDDAKPKVIKRRLEGYFQSGGIRDGIVPVLKQRTTYIPINGNLDLEVVRERVRLEIHRHLEKNAPVVRSK